MSNLSHRVLTASAAAVASVVAVASLGAIGAALTATPAGAAPAGPPLLAGLVRGLTQKAPAPAAAPGPVTPAAAPTEPGACPVLPAPSTVGGLGSVFAVIPLFGPFTSEAVSWVPLLNEVVPAIAPLLPVFGAGLNELQPSIDLLVPVLNDLEQQGYDAISPYYEPYRHQILLAENELATALAPYVRTVVELPSTACLVSIQGLIVDALGQQAEAGELP